ncbi:hypothetical protein [Microseira sp. BLCC-F43]|jgi:hypothetical protein|uniref:hypothetical protein n=1 Tax=Microseira sp. BLCC-F43 TaxID=3153602 RepID=UPI0035BACB8E
MPRFSYGQAVKGRVKRLLAALLSFVDWEFDESNPKIEFNWQAEYSPRPKLIVKTRLIDLEWLSEKDRYGNPEKLNKEQIRQALAILRDFLKILADNRAKTQGAET